MTAGAPHRGQRQSAWVAEENAGKKSLLSRCMQERHTEVKRDRLEKLLQGE